MQMLHRGEDAAIFVACRDNDREQGERARSFGRRVAHALWERSSHSGCSAISLGIASNDVAGRQLNSGSAREEWSTSKGTSYGWGLGSGFTSCWLNRDAHHSLSPASEMLMSLNGGVCKP